MVDELADDGSREGPPASPAENWSRRDKIRAGAVSGPWRSAPRTETARRADPEPRAANPPPLAWTGRRPDAEEPGPVAAEVAPPRRGQGRRSVLLGVLVGAGIAAALVAAAIALRPEAVGTLLDEPGASGTLSLGAAPDASSSVAEPTPDAAAPVAEAEADGSLRLRVGPDLPEAREAAIVAALGDGYVVERIPFRIAVSRVGYYHAEDRAAAAALAERMSPVVDDPSGALAIRDYSKLLPDAEPGRLDLWIADQSGDG